jgi:hypothetical protein
MNVKNIEKPRLNHQSLKKYSAAPAASVFSMHPVHGQCACDCVRWREKWMILAARRQNWRSSIWTSVCTGIIDTTSLTALAQGGYPLFHLTLQCLYDVPPPKPPQSPPLVWGSTRTGLHPWLPRNPLIPIPPLLFPSRLCFCECHHVTMADGEEHLEAIVAGAG